MFGLVRSVLPFGTAFQANILQPLEEAGFRVHLLMHTYTARGCDAAALPMGVQVSDDRTLQILQQLMPETFDIRTSPVCAALSSMQSDLESCQLHTIQAPAWLHGWNQKLYTRHMLQLFSLMQVWSALTTAGTHNVLACHAS